MIIHQVPRRSQVRASRRVYPPGNYPQRLCTAALCRRQVRWRVCEVKEMKVLLEPMFRLVVEGNRVAARQGGKQPETNHQTAGYELDSA